MSNIPTSKFGTCVICGDTGRAVKRGKGLWCFNCNNKDKAATQTIKAKQRDAIRFGTPEASTDEREHKKELDKWFDVIAIEIDQQPVCWECGAKIYRPFYRHATAHILAKSIFPSVATHPSNYLILGASCCHDKTHRLDTFVRMKIWTEAVDRFRIFEHLITEKHKILNEFRDYANAKAIIIKTEICAG